MSMRFEHRTQPLELVCIYANAIQDARLFYQLGKHLDPLQREGIITVWDPSQTITGMEVEEEVNLQIDEADIILLLISPDFLASDYTYSLTMKALKRHDAGEARVIPVLLRPVGWLDTPISKLQLLPQNRRPVSKWPDLDSAFSNIVASIRRIAEEFLSPPTVKLTPLTVTTTSPQQCYVAPSDTKRDSDVMREATQLPQQSPTDVTIRASAQPAIYHRLSEVFVKSGPPRFTFVAPKDFAFLKLALEQPGRGIVVEGPSGVGKTTAVERAVEDLRKARVQAHLPIQCVLSARNPQHRHLLDTIREWHKGTVIIDDFHRLDFSLRQELVDYLKELADTASQTRKLAIVGIPRTGQSLVDTSFDVATRIDVFALGEVEDESILQMIELGEETLNIRFDRKSEIMLAVNGSLNLAQFICFNLCARAGIEETQDQTQIISSHIESAIERVMGDLAKKFENSIRHFIAMGGPRDVIGLRLLEELATTEDGFLSLPLLKDKRSDLAQGIEGFLRNNWMDKLYRACPDSVNHLFFEPIGQALVIDDPQMSFYLRKVRFSSLARQVGKISNLAERKIFISYSHKDKQWLDRLRVHLKPMEHEGIIDMWDDTKITAGILWKEAISEALETARVAVLLVSADFLASDFIAEHELPVLLSRAKSGGTTIIPVIISPSLFANTALGAFQSINAPDDPVSEMHYLRQEKTFVKVAQTILKQFKAE
jgi:hypothetical protein